MKYHGEEALGLIETRGMVPALYALDVMCKAADVILCSYENIGPVGRVGTIVSVHDVDEQ